MFFIIKKEKKMEYTSKVEHTSKSMDRLACSVCIHPTFTNLIFITPSGSTLDGGSMVHIPRSQIGLISSKLNPWLGP
jgi:hypothetical protein